MKNPFIAVPSSQRIFRTVPANEHLGQRLSHSSDPSASRPTASRACEKNLTHEEYICMYCTRIIVPEPSEEQRVGLVYCPPLSPHPHITSVALVSPDLLRYFERSSYLGLPPILASPSPCCHRHHRQVGLLLKMACPLCCGRSSALNIPGRDKTFTQRRWTPDSAA